MPRALRNAPITRRLNHCGGGLPSRKISARSTAGGCRPRIFPCSDGQRFRFRPAAALFTQRRNLCRPRKNKMADAKKKSPWLWIPTLYLAEGLPNVLVASVLVVFYKNLGVSNAAIAFSTGWLYLPWVIKPLWSPVVDLLKTRRQWIWATQFLLGAGLAGVALTIPAPHFFQLTLAFFWLLSFSSATHDIAADGFYMLATTEREQSFFVGIRSMFYRVASIGAQGGLVILTGKVFKRTGGYSFAWSIAFGLVAGIYLCFGFYHWFILPRPASDQSKFSAPMDFLAEFCNR